MSELEDHVKHPKFQITQPKNELRNCVKVPISRYISLKLDHNYGYREIPNYRMDK